jgi:hypothetical protein
VTVKDRGLYETNEELLIRELQAENERLRAEKWSERGIMLDLKAENERLREAIQDAIRYVQTGGPLHTAERLELIGNLSAALEGK